MESALVKAQSGRDFAADTTLVVHRSIVLIWIKLPTMSLSSTYTKVWSRWNCAKRMRSIRPYECIRNAGFSETTDIGQGFPSCLIK